ncbi:NADH-quinone oxidoreductase subunit C [Taylorella equigenitalis]|uniref:NADH-quinone oxidoreductase subunit C n=3 Tax=Taylorella equigenitalis TaxID=29575 RepID=A0A654KHU7_TAYEM|nr:NADH-quinone oxidoreductase subunit C [Taylorella equigenitalis]ADU91970.1 NADH-ubiquinone oxidoreductase chain C [Taylorella equigenitalis MCE9]AFN35533.1 NADH-quinone oxidoreductase subunit C [Taylorella equigenitalis ATCC 35865]ASY30188.1 NADH-quinone oxidoreductase subunit C [Taylorella equigenitalis]ASY37491.1 NADH-quinone oxidoreductase subunit C [Taylorella equigenitalis]ASY38960.1 NADH-quinone oxidoreductase subunit C [Taylorella equigenitalis]
MRDIEDLKASLIQSIGDKFPIVEHVHEITIDVPSSDWVQTCITLRDHVDLRFDIAVDLCGVDYSKYGFPGNSTISKFPNRYAVVLHLLSTVHNSRVRVRTFALDDELPMVRSLTDVWANIGWFEREAFDMFGIVFEGHPDLRRILTDYGFIGHPLRKDFPVSGYVEMIFDEEQNRVVYQPVSIEPREITPRIIREEGYGGIDNV